MLEQFRNLSQKEIDKAFLQACIGGDLMTVDYLLTSPELVANGIPLANINHDSDESFRVCCSRGHLDIVKYLLTSPKLTKYSNLHAVQDFGFRFACHNGNLEIVEYLTTSPDIIPHGYPDIHTNDNFGLLTSALNGYFDITTFLLTSPELTAVGHTLPSVHFENDKLFKFACNSQNNDLVDYLIFERNIQITENIHSYLIEKCPISEVVWNKFSKRELNNALDQHLPQKSTNNQTRKI